MLPDGIQNEATTEVVIRARGARPNVTSRIHTQPVGHSYAVARILRAMSSDPAGAVDGLTMRCRRLRRPGEFTMNGIGRRWIISSAGVLGVAGVMRLFDAIWPFRYHDVLSEDLKGVIFGHSLRSYGWN